MPSLSYATASRPLPAHTSAAGERDIVVTAKKQPSGDSAFETMVDALNPLQIIPGVGQAYRKVSGDKASAGAQLAGKVALGAALGGPIGAAVGAGVFVLEKALPGVFGMIGNLFSSGKNSDHKADMPGLTSERVPDGKQGAAAPARRPLIEGLDVRPGSKPKSLPQAQLGKATPTMTLQQFDALMQNIGAQPIASAPAKSRSAATGGSDVAAMIQANLEKYQRQQAQAQAGGR